MRDRPARRAAVAPDRCVCRVVGSQVFFVSLSRSRQFRRRSRSFLSSPRFLSCSLARACVHACVHTSVHPSVCLTSSLSLSIASLIPPEYPLRIIPAARLFRVTYSSPLILHYLAAPFLCLSQNTPVILSLCGLSPCSRASLSEYTCSPFLGFRSAENIAFTSPRCVPRSFSFAYIKNPNRVSLRLFSHNSASRALVSSVSAPTRPPRSLSFSFFLSFRLAIHGTLPL